MDLFDELKNLEKEAKESGDKDSPQAVPQPSSGLDYFDDFKSSQKDTSDFGDKSYQEPSFLTKKDEEKLVQHFKEGEELLGLISSSSKSESTFTRETKNEFETLGQETMDLSFGTSAIDKLLEESTTKMEHHKASDFSSHKTESSFLESELFGAGHKSERAGGDRGDTLLTEFEQNSSKGVSNEFAAPDMMEIVKGIDQVSPPESPYHRINVSHDNMPPPTHRDPSTVQHSTSEILFERDYPNVTGHGILEELPPNDFYDLTASFTGSAEEFSKGVGSLNQYDPPISAGTDFEKAVDDKSGISKHLEPVKEEKTELHFGSASTSSFEENLMKESQDEPYSDRISPNMMDYSEQVENRPIKVEKVDNQYSSNMDFMRDDEPVVPACPPQPPVTSERFDLDDFKRETPSPNQMDFTKQSDLFVQPSAPFYEEPPLHSFTSTEIKVSEPSFEIEDTVSTTTSVFKENAHPIPSKSDFLSEDIIDEHVEPFHAPEKTTYLDEDIFVASVKSTATTSSESGKSKDYEDIPKHEVKHKTFDEPSPVPEKTSYLDEDIFVASAKSTGLISSESGKSKEKISEHEIKDKFAEYSSVQDKPTYLEEYSFVDPVKTSNIFSDNAKTKKTDEEKLPEKKAHDFGLDTFESIPTYSLPSDLIKETKEEKPKPVKTVPVVEAKPIKQTKAILSTDEVSQEVQQILNIFNPCAWFDPNKLHPTVSELVYWRDPKKSGVVFGSIFVILVALAFLSFISVVAYTSLAVLSGTLAFRLYKSTLQAVQKTQDGHPFKEYLEMDLALEGDKAQEVCNAVINYLNKVILQLRHLFLVEDFVDSAKFAAFLYLLTYIGSWFNGLTLVILAFIALFGLPKVYESNKNVIDQYLDLVWAKISEINQKVSAALPFGKKDKAQ